MERLFPKHQTSESTVYLNQYSISFKNIESGLRYAITQWEGEQNDVVVEFKRMRLSHNPKDDERTLQIELIIENILDKIRLAEPKSNGTFSHKTYDLDNCT